MNTQTELMDIAIFLAMKNVLPNKVNINYT
jgi:hypothetical protein